MKPATHCLRIGIDGIDAAGKSTLADELARQLSRQGQSIIQASVDGFHNPKERRYRQGPLSPKGYYEDSFNHPVLETKLLLPLGADGTHLVQTAAYDYREDRPVYPPLRQVPVGAILLFDGVFLQRPELVRHWDFVLYIDITFEECLARGLERNQHTVNAPETIERQYRRRYIPGQQIYLASCRPRERADVIVDNNEPANSTIMKESSRYKEALLKQSN